MGAGSEPCDGSGGGAAGGPLAIDGGIGGAIGRLPGAGGGGMTFDGAGGSGTGGGPPRLGVTGAGLEDGGTVIGGMEGEPAAAP